MYHRISGQPSTRQDLSVTLENFRSHLQVIDDMGCRVVALGALAAAARQHTLHDRSVAITFDDGYAESVDEVASCLAGRSMCATFFVIGNTLDGADEFWWDAVERVFASDRRLPASLTLDGVGGHAELPTATREARETARQRVAQGCIDGSRQARKRLMQRLLEWADATAPARDAAGKRPMTANEIARLASIRGIEIGAHSENHLWLPSQPFDVQLSEAVKSKQRLEALLNRLVTSFSYPYGAYDRRTTAAVREAGFELAVTTEARPVSNGDDSFALPRYEVPDDPAGGFADFLQRAVP